MRFLTRIDVENETHCLLQSTDTLRVPVPVDLVAHRSGITVVAAELGEEVSGVLVLDNGRATIGYNSEHAPVRQRFSIAHELAHFVLHKDVPNARNLFIDTTRYVSVFLRDGQSSTGERAIEVQANMFAAALLMPEVLLRNEIMDKDYDLLDEEELCSLLANRFQVSSQAMSIRLANVGIITQL